MTRKDVIPLDDLSLDDDTTLDDLPPDDETPLDWIDPAEWAAAEARPAEPPSPPLTVAAKADILAASCWPVCVRAAIDPAHGGIAGPDVYKAMLDAYLAEVAPAGPVERMLAEQLFMAHHVGGQLHVKGSVAGTPEAAKVYLTAAARLMGEFRLSALALKALCAPAPATVAEPEPVAASKAPPSPARPTRGELGSKRKPKPKVRRLRADAFA